MSLKLRKLGEAAADGSAGESRNKPSRLLQVSVVAIVAIVVYVGNMVLNYAPGAKAVDEPTPTPLLAVVEPTIEPTPTPTMLSGSIFAEAVEASPTPGPTSTPVVVVVTATPTPVPPTAEVIYIQVTREVLVTSVPLPTPTPSPTVGLAPGVVRICAEVEGATALFVGGRGIVSGGCEMFTFGVGQTEVKIQVNR